MEAFILVTHTVWQIYIYWISIFDAVCNCDDDDLWLIVHVLAVGHERRSDAGCDQLELQATSLPIQTFKINFLCKCLVSGVGWQQQGILGSVSGNISLLFLFHVAALKVLQHQVKFNNLKIGLAGGKFMLWIKNWHLNNNLNNPTEMFNWDFLDLKCHSFVALHPEWIKKDDVDVRWCCEAFKWCLSG